VLYDARPLKRLIADTFWSRALQRWHAEIDGAQDTNAVSRAFDPTLLCGDA
jgi:hypothetical protein